MKITAEEFRTLPKKSITLIGMSGAGKTHISCQLEAQGWVNYSCDFVIGDKYLKEELSGVGPVTADDIGALSEYLGKLGNPEKCGFLLDLFKQRQKAYYDAEVSALHAMGDALSDAQGDFLHDSTGSLCELEDDSLMEKIGMQTLFVYLKTDEKTEQTLLQRAREYPKPLFFPPVFLEQKLADFLNEFGLGGVSEIDPDDFSRWVFPILFEARKPKYQKLADLYGVTIDASVLTNLKSSEAFTEIIAKALEV
ncbi:MAG: hypothetical protein COA45_00885 [Zetaproteobacteria bacterium]|nr:MAG: hypothetical protein COA45_00885 [Zetaproteobacteria bacterium]